MSLAKIREAKSFEELTPAIHYLCTNMQAMSWGDFCAYKGTIEHQANKLGIPFKAINDYAENYQTFGYQVQS